MRVLSRLSDVLWLTMYRLRTAAQLTRSFFAGSGGRLQKGGVGHRGSSLISRKPWQRTM